MKISTQATAGTGPDFDTEIAKFHDKQMMATRLLDSGQYKYFLFGGSMGPGKSYWLRWWCIRRLYILSKVFGLKNACGMLACEDYPSLKDRQIAKIGNEMPKWMGKLHLDHAAYGRCFILHPNWGGGVLCFRNLDDPSKYQSAEFAFIAVDELTKNSYETFNFLRTRLRWTGLHDDECMFVAASNPGGPGHSWVKQLWMDKLFADEWIHPTDLTNRFCYLQATADDNPTLPSSYWQMLETLPEAMRKAFRHGDWNVFIGQAFPELTKESHGCEPMPIPRGAHIYSTFDWGFGAPFSFGWWWVDGDGRIYRFAEWYGWNGQPNQGLRLSDEQIATQAIERERRFLPEWVDVSMIQRICGPDCFQKKPDYKGGGQGPSTAETFVAVGQKERHPFVWRVGDPSRSLKIRQFHERLRTVDHNGNPIMPLMMAYNTCDNFFRTVTGLIQDEHNIEDIDTKGEDHCLSGETLVCTDNGDIPISQLVGKSGRVLSVGGEFANFTRCRRTRINTEVVNVTFSDGRSIKCTLDHRFLSDNGSWIEAKDLTDERCHVMIAQKPSREAGLCASKSSTQRLKSLMGEGIGFVGSTTSTKAGDSTEQYGSFLTGLFREVMLSTIRTTIDLITKLRTLSLNVAASMPNTMPVNRIIATGSNQCTMALRSGMEARQVSSGTKISTKSIVKLLCSKMSQRYVSFAERITKAKSSQDSVQENANKSHGNSSSSIKGVKPVSVSPAGFSDVYCLDVDHASHAFAVCGGVLVHNCFDEACHIVMARPLALPDDKPKLSATDRRIDRLIKGERGSYAEVATLDQQLEIRRLESGRDAWDGGEDPD